jgi:hypothetical protein
MELLGRPDFLLTPHVAWASDEAVQGLADQLVDNIEAFARGEPVNTVRWGLSSLRDHECVLDVGHRADIAPTKGLCLRRPDIGRKVAALQGEQHA